MAEIVLSAFLTVVFEKLSSEALKKLARSKGIDSELKKLKRSLDQIQNVLKGASQKEISDEAVKTWLNGLHHLAYDIDDLLDDLATEAMHRELTDESGASTSSLVRKLIPTCCNNILLSARMRSKLDNVTLKLGELVEEKDNLGLSVKGESQKQTNRRLQTSLVDASTIVGREADKDALLQKLLGDEPSDRNFSIVPIVGMGGVGKTTLARLLYEEMQGNNHFELKAWVCVSDEFDIFNISKIIFQSIGGEDKEFKDLNLLQVALKEKISNRRFLIVLDDVWSESYADWEILARPFLAGAPGSKIIMTTRKLSLVNQLGQVQSYRLSVLSHDKSVSLFCQQAFDENNFDSHPTLKQHGEGIIEKCDGLPLALVALGRLLRSKRDEEEWKDVLDSEIWELRNSDEIVPALRLSYHDLSATLKQLFAYCSLFPKDYVFDKEELIILWMAEGFLHHSTTSKSTERVGQECFEELLSRTFFQQAPNDKSLFVMHDLMNDLATSVAGEFFIRLDIEMKKEFRMEELKKHRHMSFVCETYMGYKRFEPFKGAKSLRTFLAVGVNIRFQQIFISNKVLADLLRELPLLRVLSLSRLEIREVPEFIGSLKHLRYLNLSKTRITHLPENVCNLYNIQVLNVSGCDELSTLPENFSKLKNLKHFDIRDTPLLKKMPLGIGELKSLRTLSKIIVGGENGFAITKLKNLKNLHGKISISGLGNVQNAMHAREANLSQKRLSELELDCCNKKEVLNELQPRNDTLKKLKIVSYKGTEFPKWVGDPLFLRLTHVWIEGCEECTSLPRLGQLPSLKELFIGGMSKVKVVGWELLGTGVAFPSLEILRFDKMSGWEVWSTNISGAFPCLRELRLYNCPNLVQVSLEALPSLRELRIEYCGNLVQVSLEALPSLQELCIARCGNLVQVSLEALPSLRELCIRNCHNLVQVSLEALPSLRVLDLTGCSHGVLTSLVHVASSLTKLEIKNISGLTEEAWRGVIQYLRDVEKVKIDGCNEIRYLWESEAEASKYLVNLRSLRVYDCSKLVSLGEKEEEDNCGTNLTSLTTLIVSLCKSLERCRCPGSVENMSITFCDSITSVSFPAGGGQKLKSVSIWNCEKLLEEELGGGEKSGVLINSSMRMLEDVYIDDWPNLKSITALGCFVNLTRLTIIGCTGMESFPDHELPNLNSLTHMRILNCTSLDDSFPRGLWPPNLCELEIGPLKKPISEWGPQKFPISLVDLKLYGGACDDDVRNFDQLSNLLPSSLTSLWIIGFEKVESVSMGLQHLTSLQHLDISYCPKTRDLPEMLLPSLLSLRIYGCPNLKERCSRRGSYWPRISRIPKVME